ncbi:MAG: teichoic acid biosynthesis protein, partial [Deltaproteobacteria bacterium]|nr:teichoic acid biosynthesis protein [Deltaproteobacteria bacterium]
EVQIVVSGRAAEYLGRRYPNVGRIEGLKMVFEDNTLDRSRTVWEFIKGLPTLLQENYQKFLELGESFDPDAVISDFETFSYLFGKQHELPILSVDNMQVINRCQLEVPLDEHGTDFLTAKTVVKTKLPGCFHYLVTSFFFPPVRKKRTSLFPPILRRQILEAPKEEGDHLLVYQTTTSNEHLMSVLQTAGIPCRVYGLGEGREGLVERKPFSEEGFIEDLATSRAVLATGGFSLMGEAVFLGKPLLAVPLEKQFEQTLNALYLEKLGYGAYCERLEEAALSAFLANLDTYRETLAGYQQDGNAKILEAIDALLAGIEEGRERPA